MSRFSLTGHFATPLIFVTGASNIALTSGALPWPINSEYRALLDFKMVVYAAMIAIALTNRYFWVPRLRNSLYAIVCLRTMTIVELGFSLCAVAAVSFFGILIPK